jgi:hypothetical protein
MTDRFRENMLTRGQQFFVCLISLCERIEKIIQMCCCCSCAVHFCDLLTMRLFFYVQLKEFVRCYFRLYLVTAKSSGTVIVKSSGTNINWPSQLFSFWPFKILNHSTSIKRASPV